MKEKFQEPVGQPFVFPDSILKQINECTSEGFLLFFIDQNGKPEVRAHFSAPIIEMGLRAYATKFLKGVSMVEESNIAEAIYEENNRDSDEDFN